MKHSRRLRMVGALLLAGWCSLWTVGLAATKLGLPGILSLTGTAGVFELAEVMFGVGHGVVCLTCLAFCFLLFWLAICAVQWLDRASSASAALHWVLSSGSLRVALSGVLVLACTATLLEEQVRAAILMSVVLIALLLPFSLLNPATLRRDRLQAWWRPFWPGGWAIAVSTLAGVVTVASSFALDALLGDAPAWQMFLANTVDLAMSLLILLACTALWIHRSPRLAWSALRHMLQPAPLGEAVAVSMIAGVLPCVVLGLPLIGATLMQVFILPQYDQWVGQGGLPTLGLRALFLLCKTLTGDDVLLGIGVAAQGLLALTLGRWWTRRVGLMQDSLPAG